MFLKAKTVKASDSLLMNSKSFEDISMEHLCKVNDFFFYY